MNTKNLPYLAVTPAGHGHYKIVTTYYKQEISCITTNMPAVDSFKEGKKSGYLQLRSICVNKHKEKLERM